MAGKGTFAIMLHIGGNPVTSLLIPAKSDTMFRLQKLPAICHFACNRQETHIASPH